MLRPHSSRLVQTAVFSILCLLLVAGSSLVAATEAASPELSCAVASALAEAPFLTPAEAVLETGDQIQIYNPCYDFADDPVAGCYYQWSPQTYCCVNGGPGCRDVCW